MRGKERTLFHDIASFSALHGAALRAARGKRSKPGAGSFLANPEKEILKLERKLRSARYRPGRYKTIEIFDSKHCIVSAAPFRDRVVHHAFCAVCEPLFERGFIHDSYANRKGKGTHRAMARYEESFRDLPRNRGGRRGTPSLSTAHLCKASRRMPWIDGPSVVTGPACQDMQRATLRAGGRTH